jgi:hypothetical protein
VALSNPPTVSLVLSAISSVAYPNNFAKGIIATKLKMNISESSTCTRSR